MRFKTSIRNISTFTSTYASSVSRQASVCLTLGRPSEFAASLSSLGKVAWVRLDNEQVRFTIIPEQGTQVWAVLSIDSIFETYTIQSASPNNTINLELPIEPLHRALKSALSATSASLRLTKKDNIPLLSLTIVTNTVSSGTAAGEFSFADGNGFDQDERAIAMLGGRDRETTITQDVPVRVLNPANVEGIHEPRCREPDVHILLPSLMQLKAISDRFTRLASAAANPTSSTGLANSVTGPRLELCANMHGSLRLSITTDAFSISSRWTGLSNPELDPAQIEGGEEGIRDHPSTRMRELGRNDSEEGWAKVRIDGRDWSRVLSVGRLGGRVIACFAHEHALILYVYLSNDDDGGDESVLTYYISSYSA
ncbi:MAG: hypothetical protein M1817_004593 [Caeruleum heppii]|nr:MAG: hypothetical protein M1817_004593 [Caeruleum heppii]